MKGFGMVGAFVAWATVMPAAGHADSWCLRDSAGISPGICAFSSAQDCIRAALINPAAGLCAREELKPTTAAAPPAKPPAKRRAARLRRTGDR